MLENNIAMLSQFMDKLHKYGYFDEVSSFYKTGYYIRDTFQYRVCEGFPCITKSLIPTGISKVEYGLSINQCEKYMISIEELISQLRGGLNAE